jgi:hypothetical protein
MVERQVVRRAGVLGLIAVAAIVSVALVSPAVAAKGSAWKQVRPMADSRYLQNTSVYASDPVSVASGDTDTATADCPAGMQAIGGGVDSDADGITFSVLASGPTVGGETLLAVDVGKNAAATGWSATVENLDMLAAHDFAVGVICAR